MYMGQDRDEWLMAQVAAGHTDQLETARASARHPVAELHPPHGDRPSAQRGFVPGCFSHRLDQTKAIPVSQSV